MGIIESVTGLDKKTLNGEIRVELDTAVWTPINSELKPVDGQIIINQTAVIEVDEHTIVNLQNFDTTLSVFFRIAAKPAKGKAKKPKKGKTPEPGSVAPTPPPDEQLFTKVIQLSCNAKTQSILCGGGPIPEDYQPPSLTSASATPSGKGGKKGGKGKKGTPAVEDPIIVNVTSCITILS